MVKRIKIILLLLAVFVFTITLAIYYENNYRILVRFFFRFFQGDKIKFTGKNFHLLASPYIVISFGLFSVMLIFFLLKQTNKERIFYLILVTAFFFIATIATTYIDSLGKVVECTACHEGIRNIGYNEINYAFHFIISLVAGLSPLLWKYFKKLKKPPKNKSIDR